MEFSEKARNLARFEAERTAGEAPCSVLMVASRAQYRGRRNDPVCARSTCRPKGLDLRFRVRVGPTGNQIGHPEQRWRRFAPRVILFLQTAESFQ